MSINEESNVLVKIEPTAGEITRMFWGEESPKKKEPPEEKVAYKLCRLMDGLKESSNGLKVSVVQGFIQATNGSEFADGHPKLGLKIHLVVPWNDENYLGIVEQVALLCRTKNKDGMPTSFKVMFPQNSKSMVNDGNPQGLKSITITPAYLGPELTNVPETIRLVGELRKIVGGSGFKETKTTFGLFGSEHKSGEGIYIRPGAFTREGEAFMGAARDSDFQTQLENNLKSPDTDGNLFKEQFTEAVAQGLL